MVALLKALNIPYRDSHHPSGRDRIDRVKFCRNKFVKGKKGYVLDSEALEEIIIGGPSRIEMDIKIIGKAAHAVERNMVFPEIAAHAISLLKTGWIDPITTVNIGLIEGGHVLNAVPENASVQIECRSQNHKRCLNIVDQ